MSKNMSSEKIRIISYIFFGFITTLSNFLVYSLSVTIIELSIEMSTIIAWIVSVFVAYVTNKIWVFKSNSKSLIILFKEVGLFYSARLISGLFELGMITLSVRSGYSFSLIGVEGLGTKLIISIVIVFLNYYFSKYAIFQNDYSLIDNK